MSIKNPIFTKKNIMFALLKFGAIFYSFVTLAMFFTYGFWWTTSILFTSSMVLFLGVVAQLPIIRVWYLYILLAIYAIILTTAQFWGIEDPENYKILTILFIPMGFTIIGDMIVDGIKDIASEIFGDL